MTTPTREQVVQCDDVREAFERRFREPPFEFSLELYGEQDAWPGSYKKYSEQCAWDGYQEARADLEAENERLRKDAESLKLLGGVTNGQVVWLNINPHGWPEGTTFYAIAAAPKEK